jgi:hypothetical protein
MIKTLRRTPNVMPLPSLEKYPERYPGWAWDKYKAGLSGDEKVNAGLMVLLAKNSLGMVDKVDVDHHHDEKITTINIKILPQSDGNIIEHEAVRAITDQKSS